ncbi:hypothetical protein BDW72DRAFT_182902 [Aspergillus terricola var. indicus]
MSTPIALASSWLSEYARPVCFPYNGERLKFDLGGLMMGPFCRIWRKQCNPGVKKTAIYVPYRIIGRWFWEVHFTRLSILLCIEPTPAKMLQHGPGGISTFSMSFETRYH